MRLIHPKTGGVRHEHCLRHRNQPDHAAIRARRDTLEETLEVFWRSKELDYPQTLQRHQPVPAQLLTLLVSLLAHLQTNIRSRWEGKEGREIDSRSFLQMDQHCYR